jgi:hypothetical protein
VKERVKKKGKRKEGRQRDDCCLHCCRGDRVEEQMRAGGKCTGSGKGMRKWSCIGKRSA